MKPPNFWHDPQAPWGKILSPIGEAYQFLSTFCFQQSLPLKLPFPIICMGNLVMGGAGKTPLVIMLAQWLQTQGMTPHILSRGYGGKLSGPVQVEDHSFKEVGDEALLLSKVAPTWIAKDRVAGARAALEAAASVLILDDGHQNNTLFKDLSWIVIDTNYGFGNNHVFPAGPLREKIESGLKRAQGLLLVGDKPFVHKSSLPFIRVEFEPPIQELEALRGQRILPFAGIGRPQKFFSMLENYTLSHEFELLKGISFSDHHVYSTRDIVKLQKQAQTQRATLVTTEKDKVKLLSLSNIRSIGLSPRIIEGNWHDMLKAVIFKNEEN